MNVYVLGVAMYPPTLAERGLRLEEIAWRVSRAALESAGVARGQLDSLTIGACDELDGRPISSMLMSAPAGGYDTDEIKVTDSGATAFCLAYARFLSGESNLGLVTSWCKSSKTDFDAVMRLRGDPFYTRPLGIDGTISDAMFAQAVSGEFGVSADEVARRTVAAYERAARNPRGMRHAVPSLDSIGRSEMEAVPLRRGHRAPMTDGAVALVLASADFLAANPSCQPLARVSGVGWATDSYRLGRDRLRALRSARTAWSAALKNAGLSGADQLDVIELDSQSGYHEAAYARAFGLRDDQAISPSGGPFAQNPVFCSGLVNAAEAVLQVAGQAGPVQRAGAKRAAAHGCHGNAQQGNVVLVFESAGARQ